MKAAVDAVPSAALAYGFTNDPVAIHTSRTIMLAELQLLLDAVPESAGRDQYRQAVLDENVLLKRTATTRRKSFRYLRELYTLDRSILLFRALRDLWTSDETAQPLLALLCATARDPVLRSTAWTVLDMSEGMPVTAAVFAERVGVAFDGRYNNAIRAKVGRNLASSWTQSGHLSGRTRKRRTQAEARPESIAYALLLGHLCGERGDALFESLWIRLLDAPQPVLRSQAQEASRRGWLEYRHAGGVTDISFRYLMREEEPRE